MQLGTEVEIDLRAEAIRQVKKRRDFLSHLVAYALVNVLLVAIWTVAWVASGIWFPWPLFVIFGWGVGLAFHAWDTFGRRPITEEEIRREEVRLRP